MTEQEWMDQVHRHSEVLRSLVRNYHPASANYSSGGLPITAPGPELACQVVRQEIAKETTEPPTETFMKAEAAGDWQTINSLLDSAWFGVPESTECWRIPGFSEAVDLMEDCPEEEGK